MKVLNKDKLVAKTSKKLEKLQEEMAKSYQIKCQCCGAKIQFDGYDIQHEQNDYDYDYNDLYYIDCPSCNNHIYLNSKFSKVYSNRFEINHCESILGK